MKELICALGILVIASVYSCVLLDKKKCIVYWMGILGCLFLSFGMTETQVFRSAVFLYGIYNVVFTVALFVNKIKVGPYFQYVIWLIPVIGLIIIWTYYFTNQVRFGALAFLAVMQTNVSEAFAYCRDNSNLSSVIVIIFVFGSYIYFCRMMGKITFKSFNKVTVSVLAGILVISMFGIYRTGRSRSNIFRDVFDDISGYLIESVKFQEEFLARKLKFKENIDVQCKNDAGLYVLVIGESHNRDNMHAYGYAKETTPWLDSIKNDNNTFFFTRAFSCHTHTVPVLSYALTAKNQYNNIKLSDAVSVIELANAAGYDTYWFSNQVHYGAWDTPVSVIADAAKCSSWLNQHFGATTKTNVYDEALVGELSKVKPNKKALVVFHLMDCHGSYEDRYPDNFAKFGKQNSISRYDNAILYNDYVVKCIYDTVSKMSNFRAMLYLSDHADAPLEGQSHDYAKFVPGMTHIPMYMLVSDTFKNNQGDCFRGLRKHLDSVWTNDLLFDLLADVLGIEMRDIREDSNDLASDKYNDDVIRFRTGHGKKNITDDPMFIGGGHRKRPDKYWLHRMNHSENLNNKNLMAKYKGIELDIRYEEGKNDFDVNHDDHGTIENSLRQYLGKMSCYDHKIWLDFKNLNENNAHISLVLLTEILKGNNVDTNRIIVESSSLYGNKVFYDAGYYTSFYLPYYKLEKMTDADKDVARKKIYEIGKSGVVNAISFPAYEYEFISSVQGIEDIDMLTWESGGGPRGMWNQSYDSEFGQKLLKDNRVKVILVNDVLKKQK